MILIVTNKRDITCDLIVLELQRRFLSYFRLNTEDLPKYLFRYTSDNDSTLDCEGTTLSLKEITSAYFRRPDIPIPLGSVARTYQQYVATEWQAVLQALYCQLDDRWLNSPNHIALAENKIRQLATAKALGFRVPETLVGNDPGAISSFAATSGVIGKPLKRSVVVENELERVIFTSRLDEISNADAESIRACPFILQREIKKSFDIRVTVVGDSVFAATIDSQGNPDTEVDWRKTSSPDLTHEAYQLPPEEADRCKALTQAMGLRYGAIDLVLGQDGHHWFLEINPNGQWGWIEVRTGQPIAAAIVSELEKISRETKQSPHSAI